MSGGKGKGSRGFGAYQNVCRKVVLDANLVQYAPIYELEALSRRGFTVSISIEGLQEIWTRSIKENSYSFLSNRIKNLAPVLDPAAPIAFVGTAMLSTVGNCTARVREEASAFRDDITASWRRVSADGLSESEWKRIGTAVKAEVDAFEAWWLDRLNAFRELERRIAEKTKDSEPYDRERGLSVIRRSFVDDAPVETKPSLNVRADAHLRYLMAKLRRSLRGEGTGNDWYDARHLQHIAEPAFLATRDYRLIQTVDDSNSLQRAWVRAPIELLEDHVALCEPWGAPAEVASRAFIRPSKRELLARDQKWNEDRKREQTGY